MVLLYYICNLINMNKMSNNINSEVLQLRKDYDSASCVSGQEKKDLIAKYNVNSKKAKDIQFAILLKLQELRQSRHEFDNADVTDFARMSNSDTQYYEFLKNENDDFVKYLFNIWETEIKLPKYRDLFRWVNLKSFGGFSFSSHEKWLIKRYQKIREELDSRNPEKVEAVAKEKASVDEINSKLTVELEDFKTEYLKRVEAHASIAYDELPSVIESLTKKLIVLRKEYEDKRKETRNYNITWSYYQRVEKQEREISRKKSILKMYPTKESFIAACLKDAELTFRGNVNALAMRVYEKDFVVEKIKVSNVKDDPKIFKLFIEDGTKKLYCRSILAAQFSDKMVPHFRFIMTDRK